jgi:hypothetical protein
MVNISSSSIIIGSTRPGRHGEAVAKWVYEIASQSSDAHHAAAAVHSFLQAHSPRQTT